jgi:serine/threonine-protein kinase
MPGKNWSQVKEVFHEALRRDTAEREIYLEQACEGDVSFRIDVESLLISLAEAENFLEQPVVGEIAKPAAWRLQNGQAISHYKIVEPIGIGGMGEVYLATDTRLNRQVALKILPEQMLADRDRLRRFQREADVVSALNHPNILTIYEFGTEGDIHLFASEFVRGETLRERLSRGHIPVSDALDIAVQITSALNAAHEAGVIHRDIKPENVMIRDDGYVKVLDFGLAKQTESGPSDPNANTRLIVSQPGLIMGTVAYMSPEQVRSMPIDTRTDLFSLGIVLYEMLSGKSPFAGETTTDVIAATLQLEPQPITQANQLVPAELGNVITKLLQKDRNERYQTAKDLLADLKKVQRHHDLNGAGEPINRQKTVQTTEILHSTKTSSDVAGVRRRNRAILVSVLVLLLALAAAGVGYYVWETKINPAGSTVIKSLAVLPLRSLDKDENLLGLGIADAVIRRISQTGELNVRPLSSVRRYLSEDADALTTARQLDADAVLEGNVQRAGDHLRVSVNLLRTSDGISLWADSFDMHTADIFTIQDTVAQQVAARLKLRLDSAQQMRFIKQYTSSSVAYDYYVKGIYNLDQRGYGKNAMPQMEATIDFFKNAIKADPNYALAHAQLAYAYIWTALFIMPDAPEWAERGKDEIRLSQALDSQLAESHLANALLLWSSYEGFQNEAAVRELLAAEQLNPNVGHSDLAATYGHMGLENLAWSELQIALKIDPTSQTTIDTLLTHYFLSERYDEWFDAYKKLHPEGEPSIWYLLGKGRLDDAQKVIEQKSEKAAKDLYLPSAKGVFFALKGDYRSAEAEIPAILNTYSVNDPTRHHATYNVACIYALAGKSSEAVRWLKETATTGYPNYPVFERDPYLNNIRQAPEFIQFMAEMKAQGERYKQEFGS